jgi:hypothetical protein
VIVPAGSSTFQVDTRPGMAGQLTVSAQIGMDQRTITLVWAF